MSEYAFTPPPVIPVVKTVRPADPKEILQAPQEPAAAPKNDPKSKEDIKHLVEEVERGFNPDIGFKELAKTLEMQGEVKEPKETPDGFLFYMNRPTYSAARLIEIIAERLAEEHLRPRDLLQAMAKANFPIATGVWYSAWRTNAKKPANQKKDITTKTLRHIVLAANLVNIKVVIVEPNQAQGFPLLSSVQAYPAHLEAAQLTKKLLCEDEAWKGKYAARRRCSEVLNAMVDDFRIDTENSTRHSMLK